MIKNSMEPVVYTGCQKRVSPKLAVCPYCRAPLSTAPAPTPAPGVESEGADPGGSSPWRFVVGAGVLGLAVLGASLAYDNDVEAGGWIVWGAGAAGWLAGILGAIVVYRMADGDESRLRLTVGALLGGVIFGSFAVFGLLRLANGGASNGEADRVPCVIESASVHRSGSLSWSKLQLACRPTKGDPFTMKITEDGSRPVVGASVFLQARRGRLGVWVSWRNHFVYER